MGHYDDDYEYESNRREQARLKSRIKARNLLEQVMRDHTHDADDPTQFRIKIREAIFWLYGDLPDS